jgi:SWIM zinc finger
MSTNPIVQQWEVTSTTDTSKDYIVSKRKDGAYSCSCPHWKFHKAPKPVCKHIAALLGNVPTVIPALVPTREQFARIDALLGSKRPSTATPQPVPAETFTVSVLENPRRKFRADL